MSFPTTARVLTVVVAAVNVGDILVHIAVNDVEPLRVTGNVVVIATALSLLLWSHARRALVPLLAAAVSLALNLVFIAISGIGPLGVILILATTVLLGMTSWALRRRREQAQMN